MIIREERPSDIEAITEVTIAAFKTCRYGNHTEQFIIKALRAAGALAVSLVADDGGTVVGHIAFSAVTICGQRYGWYSMGPVSVRPDRQRQGIGKSLINEGLRMLKEAGAKGCVLVGEPEYYEKFGFRNLPELTLEGVPKENFLALPFGENRAQGPVVFHEGFRNQGPPNALRG
ncbi:MAG: N-acetyltransferase [Planctomycetota bacterium]|nr:MAG: N-acetyltransferase [Planctomycetota bacterium]